VRVVIADDETLLREGLARLLGEAGFQVVGKAANAEELLRRVQLTRPDVAIVDIKMPPTHTEEGLVAAQEIRSTHPEVGVLVLSHYVESRYAMRLLEEHPERSGYLLKERVSDVAVLVDALRRIDEGECVLDPTIVSRLVGRPRDGSQLDELTASVVTEGLATWSGDGDDRKSLIVCGRSHLLEDVRAMEDLERVRLLFEDLDTKTGLIQLLGLAEGAEGVRIFIGSENKLFSLSGSALIVSPFEDTEQKIVGVLGVIGPTRLNYARIIPMVDYTAKLLGRLVP